MKIIELEKDFGGFKVAAKNITFEDKMIHGIIGPNGCGKTTLAKLIAGLIPAGRRKLELAGMEEREITMTGQKPFMMRDTVRNNLIYPLKLRGIKPERGETERWLSLCGLEGRERAYAPSLSSGQQQKLALARAMIFRPKLIIIDESLSNLDIDSVELFEREILRIQETAPVTWIIISHQMAHLRRLCQRLHFMDGGHMIVSGSPGEIFDNPAHPKLIRFLKYEA